MNTLEINVHSLHKPDDLEASQGAAAAIADHNIPAVPLSADHPNAPTVSVSNYGHSVLVDWQLSTNSDADPSISIHIGTVNGGIVLAPRLWVVSEAYGVPASTTHTAMDEGNMGEASMTQAVEAVISLFPGSPMAKHLIDIAENLD